MNTKQLKAIAISSMVFDHVTKIFPLERLFLPLSIKLEMANPQNGEAIASFFLTTLPLALAFIGRLAAPIFMFCVTVGFFHTSNIKKYIARMFLFANVSQIPYILFDQARYRVYGMEARPFSEVSLNILFSLGLGLLSIYYYEQLKSKSLLLRLLPVGLAALIAHIIHTEGSEVYILTIFAFYMLRGVPKSKQAVIWIFVLLFARWGLVLFTAEGVQNRSFNLLLNTLGPYLGVLITFLFNGEKGKITKSLQYGMYWFYPAHLLLLALIGFLYY
jgi:hypothetical protein